MTAKSKILSSICAGLALASTLLSPANAQDVAAKFANVSIVSVDRMSLSNSGVAFWVAVDITLKNANPESIKFRRADLEVSIKSAHPDAVVETVDLGPSHLLEIVIPGGSVTNPGTVRVTANVLLGPATDGTVVKLVQLFNAIGDPGNNVSLLLHGSSEVGVSLPNGWVFKQGETLRG
jgi:hypothetical protein